MMEKREGVMDLMEQAFLFGLGVASYTREKVDKTVEDLVDRGRVSREEAREVVEKMRDRGTRERSAIRDAVREELRSLLMQADVATKEDVRRLEAAIAALRAEETEAHVLEAPEQPSGDLPPDMAP
ncbi:MAG: polyhydroxyalkanoate synthesis regulator [Coriobacteriia bacterium]|nr:polyhydroxyalkanoate synthesis regulator [Coriobacteriia bacterium]